MKTLAALTIAAVISSSSTAVAQSYFPDSTRYACVNAAKAAEFYRAALSSPNIGVVESALAHVAMIKLASPRCELKSIQSSLAEVELRGANAEIRYKAWIVVTLMDHPDMFAGVAKGGYDNPDAFFAALAGKLVKSFASN